MGMRNVVGEKSELWHVVAKGLGLPAPTDHEWFEQLSGKDAAAWMRMGDTIRNWFRVQVVQGGALSRAQEDYFQKADPDSKIRDLASRSYRNLEVAMLMRCVGILEAAFAEHEAQLERETYVLWSWNDDTKSFSKPTFYEWWTAPESWTKEQADANEDGHEAWDQRRKLIAQQFTFTWA